MSQTVPTVEPITIGELCEALRERLQFELVTDKSGFSRSIEMPLIQKPGLVLAGMFEFLQEDRIQILGRSEIKFLEQQPDGGETIVRRLCQADLPLLVITRGLEVPRVLADAARARGIPLLVTPVVTGETIEAVTQFLQASLAPRISVHGVMLEVFGIGVLIMGRSGIGKSECALELITRGHRFVADDAVEIREIESELVARSPEITLYHMEVRGLGIINVREMFGISAVRDTKVVELAVRLVPFSEKSNWDRLGTAAGTWHALGRDVTLLEIPVAAARNLGVLLEIAVEQHLLRESGSDACHEIQAAVARKIAHARRRVRDS
ncbi:MAG: HPr(Ser) kinase/phosphatase [Acidobacteriota bacterium]|nr:HPr(Ser) kinase/phosphatase [Acidobacteriota bacterium]